MPEYLLGQQQTVTGKNAGELLRRTISALAIAALVAVILAVVVAPAFAGQGEGQNGTDSGYPRNDYNNSNFHDFD